MSSRPTTKARVVLALLALVLAATACGSTVPADQLATANDLAEEELGSPGSPGSTSIFGGDPAATASNPGSTGSLTSGGPTPGGSGNGTGAAMFGRGVTSTKIRIGVIEVQGADTLSETFGTNPVDTGSTDFNQIVIDDIHKHGGIAGRQIEFVPYTVDLADANFNASVSEQQACEYWTRDEPVFAAFGPSGWSDSFKSCLAKGGVVNLGVGVFTLADDSSYRQFPSLFEVNVLSLTRLAKVQIDGLVAGRFFDAAPTERLPGCAANSCVGLLTFDDPVHHRAVDQVLKPALAAGGVKLSGEHYFTVPRTYSDAGKGIGEISGVILRFKAAGINRIVIYADTGAILQFFAQETNSQDYYPAYGLSSFNLPQILVDSGNIDPRNLRGAVTVGWNPMGDVGERPYTAHGPGFAPCIQLMKRERAEFPSNASYLVAVQSCDLYRFLKAAVEAGLPSINANSFVAGADRLGSRFPGATSYAVSFGATRHYGVAAVRNSTFNEACTCFKYSGELRRIP